MLCGMPEACLGSPDWLRDMLQRTPGVYTISGSPGSGKSVLASQLSSGSGVLAFNFSNADYRRSTYRDLLISFCLQLLYIQDSLFESSYVRKLYKIMALNSDTSSPDLYRFLYAMLMRLSDTPIHCIIDALDECDETSRAQLVNDFTRMAGGGLTSCRVIITCRPTPAITTLFDLDDEQHNVNLDKKMGTARGNAMTEWFSDPKFEHLRAALEKEDATPLKVRLISHLAKAVDIPELSRYPDYDSVYERILAEVDAPRLWLQAVLLAVSFAKRPLTINELAAMLGVDPAESTPAHHQSMQKMWIQAPKQLKEDLELTLGPLLHIEANVVHLVHDTLREFIRNNSKNLFPNAGLPASKEAEAVPDVVLLRKCLVLLSNRELRKTKYLASGTRFFDTLCDTFKTRPQDFVSYAAACWTLHMNDTADKHNNVTDNCFSSFWDDDDSRSWWARNYASSAAGAAGISSEFSGDRLEIASSFGLIVAARSALTSLSTENRVLNISDFRNAIVKGDVELVSAMLLSLDEGGALWSDILLESFTNGHYKLLNSIYSQWPTESMGFPSAQTLRAGLVRAARNGHWPLFKEVLEDRPVWESRVDGLDMMGLISEASQHGRDGVVQVLLAADAEKKSGDTSTENKQETKHNTQDQRSDQPAEITDMETGIQAQSSSGANETRPSTDHNKALIEAAEFGSAAVVKLLVPSSDLEYTMDVQNMTALHTAAWGKGFPISL